MCTTGLRHEVMEALAPFWKRDSENAQEKLRALIARLEHGDEIAMTFGGKHAAKNGMMLHIVRPMLHIVEEHEPIVARAIAAGVWGDNGEVTLRATVRLPEDTERRRYAKDQFVYLMSQPFAGLREFHIQSEQRCAA